MTLTRAAPSSEEVENHWNPDFNNEQKQITQKRGIPRYVRKGPLGTLKTNSR